MSNTIQNDGLSLGAASGIPAIQTFQIDPSGLGGIAESVNLYRGDVNVPINLISFQAPGGLEASVSILYHSNIGKSVDTWNLDAPTGPLGLGWSFGYEFIALSVGQNEGFEAPVYYLVANGASNQLFQTEETSSYREFEIESYQYWQIRYYPGEERWEIVKEDGSRYRYGGGGFPAAASPVQYGIKWGGANGNWVDSSTITTGQRPYEMGWNLSEIRSTWGNRIVLEYENDVAQLGGNAGLEYTRSSRLKRVSDPVGRTFVYFYKPKRYDSDVREYQYPQIHPTAPNLVAYQFRLETQYLDRIEVSGPPEDSGRILTLEFDYELRNISLDHPSDADFYKRYLNEVIIRTNDGLALPSFSFSYFNQEKHRDPSFNRGAVERITYPQGGSVFYTYKETQPGGTERTREVSKSGIPRVWFGSDYAVMTHYEGVGGGLPVDIYMWNGMWALCPASYHFPVEMDLSTLEVSPAPEFFAIKFHTKESTPRLFVGLFHKEKGRYGQWFVEQQFSVLPISGGDQGIAVTGDEFAIAIASGGALSAKVWDRLKQTWIDRSNQFQLNPNADYALSAYRSHFALATHTSNGACKLEMYRLNPNSRAFEPIQLKVDQIPHLLWDKAGTPSRFWALGTDYAATTYVTEASESEVRYKIQVQQWNQTFQADLNVDKEYKLPGDTKLPFAQSIASGSVVANLGNLFRYDGLNWIEGQLPYTASDPPPSFIYGSDAAVVSGEASSAVSLFDPYTGEWQLQSVSGPSEGIAPTINGNYMTMGRNVYFRDSEGSLHVVAQLDPNMDRKSLVNRAPNFIAYQDDGGSTHVFPLENGGVNGGAETKLPGQKIVTEINDSGTQLVGNVSLLTFEGDFNDPKTLHLYQYVNREVSGPVTAYPVAALSIDDGMPSYWGQAAAGGLSRNTRYYYDCQSLTVTPDGSVFEYSAATAVYGVPGAAPSICETPLATTPFGRTEYRYHNNRTPLHDEIEGVSPGNEVYYYSYLAGSVFDKTDYTASGDPKQRDITLYDVRTEREPLDAPGTRVPLFGAYIKPKSVTTSVFEEAIPVPASLTQVSDGVAVPEDVIGALAVRGIDVGEKHLVRTRIPGQWRLFPSRSKPFFIPIAERGGALVAGIPVDREVSYEYSFATGLLTADATDSRNSQGFLEIARREIYYAWQIDEYKIFKERHILSPVAVSIRLSRQGGLPTLYHPTHLALTTYQRWFQDQDPAVTRSGPARSYEARTEAMYDATRAIPVNFSDWNNQQAPPESQWRLVGQVISRLPTGNVIEAIDVSGMPTTSIMNREDTLRIAEIGNARRAEISYAGFESYENDDGWILTGNSPIAENIVSGDAHTGTRSLGMSPDPDAALERDFQLVAGRIYILSYWIKTPASFDSDPGTASWTVKIDGQSWRTFEITGTGGAWQYRHERVEVPGTAGSLVNAKFLAENRKTIQASMFLLDDLMVAPLDSGGTAVVYDALTTAVTASVSSNGGTARTLPDTYQRGVVTIGPDGQVSSGFALYLVRQVDRSRPFTFPANDPNCGCQVDAPGGGTFADFNQGDAWRLQWTSPNFGNWEVRNGRLIHPGSQPDRIQFAPTTEARDFGVRVSMFPPLDAQGQAVFPKQGIGIAIGDAFSAQWDSASGWNITLGAEAVAIQAALGTDWMVLAPVDPVSGLTSLFFLTDGHLIFGRVGTIPVTGMVGLFTETAGVAFGSVATFGSPRISMTYVDGSAKERQRQVFAGTGIDVGGSLYDSIGRAAVGVKTIRMEGAPLGYVTDYVETFDPITGILTGRAANAYPEDQGYPYTRTEFYATAQSLARMQGLPGKDLAIVQSGTFGTEVAENPHVKTLQYGTNLEGQFGSSLWPPGQYFVTRTQDANGNLGFTLTTKIDQKIADMSGPESPGGAFRISHYFYDSAGRLIRKMPPAGVAAQQAGDPDAGRWATIMNYDFLGQQTSITTPDAGTTEYIYDRASRPRFVLTAEGANPSKPLNTILYLKYDAMGRELEHGYFEAVWKRIELEENALNDPSWPGASQPHVVRDLNQWDGDGNDPLLFGRLAASTSYTDGAAQPVRDTFAYNLRGEVVSKTLDAPEFDNTPRTVTYAYNTIGEPVQLGYPAGSATPVVTFSYDLTGQMFRVGTPADSSAFATYTYDPLGNIRAGTLPAAALVERRSEYNQPGWPVLNRYSIDSATPVFQETLTYTEGGFDGAAYFDGTIASAATEDPTGGFLYQYEYDGVSELLVAADNANPDASVGIASTTEYDPNGNIVAIAQGARTYQYNYPEYTNRLTSITADGQAVDTFAFDLNGAITASTRLNLPSIAYDTFTGLTREIQKIEGGAATQTIAFSYAADGKRATKIVTGDGGAKVSSRLYVRGMQDLPLLEVASEPGSASMGDSQFIYGPDGLVALHAGSKRYRVIKDRQGSARRVIDETGAVVATFDYGPFGGRITGLGEGKSDILYYRYNGQEFDPETGLYNYQARMYDPESRRFFSTDPAAQYASAYVYTGNNPINLVDPNGEEALTAFLIVVLISAIVGAIAGAITYAVTYQGNFDAGKFFAYAAVGFVAGAAGGAAGYGAGLLATAALATIGVSTSTSIASGIVVGAVTGAADGAISSSLNQIGVNLIEGKQNIWEGVGTAAWQGAAIGGVLGAVSGGITGALNKPTAVGLKQPGSVIGHTVPEPYGTFRNVPGGQHYGPNNIGGAAGEQGVLAIRAHGGKARLFGEDLVLEWHTPAVVQKDVSTIIAELGPGFTPRGIDLTGVCWAGNNGVARSFANDLGVPVRAANVATTTGSVSGRTFIRWYRTLFQFGTFRTYYPNQLQTGWVALFGY
ncbi:MAG TPA: RHS repeat-associated core domain-containing protein [Bryobacteraceae bacterium]|nr:RHS repeat-associated core domain-containing protein [Bryobacteraceae bacterium]